MAVALNENNSVAPMLTEPSVHIQTKINDLSRKYDPKVSSVGTTN